MHGPLTLNLTMFHQGGESAHTQPGQTAQPEQPDQGASTQSGQAAPSDPSPRPAQPPEPARSQRAQAQDARKSFDQLIQGEYKEEYQRRLKAQLDRRFKAYEERKQAQDRLLSSLARRCGLKGEDPQAWARALAEEGQPGPQPREADAPAPGEEQTKTQPETQEQAASTPSPQEEAEEAEARARDMARQRARAIYWDWQRQAQAARQVYPGLDLDREMRHPQFRQLMRAGVGVRTAYEAVHRDQVLGGAMAYAARAMARKVGNALAAQQARPQESGAGGYPAGRPARPEEFTDQQVLEVARQARKAGRVTLR